MQIGVYLRLFGGTGDGSPAARWASIREAAVAAEDAGFDRIVLEDGFLYPGPHGGLGLWDPISMAAAIAAATSRIGIGHAVLNNPLRHPALVARSATTLDEISGGRYRLGIGSGNTPEDYPRFGFPADHRYSRLRESISIIRALLRTGRATLDGEFYQVPDGELALRGPSPSGPPIAIAAGKPRMLRLAAELGDEWNWWTGDPDRVDDLAGLVEELATACAEVGRDPATLRRSLDLFSIQVPDPGPATGSAAKGKVERETADRILRWRELGFDEIRLDLDAPDGMATAEAVSAMAGIVERVHAG